MTLSLDGWFDQSCPPVWAKHGNRCSRDNLFAKLALLLFINNQKPLPGVALAELIDPLDCLTEYG